MAPRIEGILLAAGESRRMGYPKPLLRIGEDTFISRSARSILAMVPRLIVVLGAHAERIRPAIPAHPGIVTVENPHFEAGQLSSLKVGLGAVSHDCEGVLVHLADHPLVKPSTFENVVAGFARGRGAIVIARCSGKRGHPVIFGKSVFRELLEAPENEGARAVVIRDPDRVIYVDVEDPGVSLDLDTPADVEKAGLIPPPKGPANR
jgi:molybdenum cofactor cytidylyltransferase